jgi:tetratricopeptide (TPR) repeat protein/Zn-dependent protease with chaperone function
MRSSFFSALAVLVLFSAAVYGQQAARNPKKEQVILKRLADVAPGAVELFQRATVAMDKGDYPQAVQLYREVTQLAPTFSPAVRRLGLSLAAEGQTDDALTLLENAVKIERSPENLASLAQILAYPTEGKEGTQAQREMALTLAKEANERYQGSDDPSYSLLMAQIALGLKKEAEFRQASETLVHKYPYLMPTHYFNAIRLAMDGSWIAAEDEIKTAERLGLPSQMVQDFLASGIHTRATAWRWAYYALYVVAAWACGLFILFVAGKVFSQLTLRFIESADVNPSTSGAETVLRRYYRGLINVAGSYYYFSIPIVIFLVLAVTGSIVYGFLAVGHIPIKLVGILVIGALVTVYKMVQSLFVKVNSEDPGRSLSPEEAPGLWSLTREVAENLGTRPLQEIRVVPGTEMAVYERGSYRERRKDLGRRILVMGLGLLPGFDQNPFRAVLAHEYGHLSHRDTAGGDVALRVNQDMMKFAYAMAYAGQAVWWNVAFQFLRLYHFIFRRISHGATRLQEVLADRAAARIYGVQPFEEGLRHVVRRQIEFRHFADKKIQEALRSGKALQNVYALEMQPEKALEEAIDHAINRQTSGDDTHPSPVDRFRLVSRVVCQNRPAPSGPMWDLFADHEAITREMSSQIEKIVKAQPRDYFATSTVVDTSNTQVTRNTA